MITFQGRVCIGPSPGSARITTPISNISSTFRKWMTKQPLDSQISKIEREPTLAISSGAGGIWKHSLISPTMIEHGWPSVLELDRKSVVSGMRGSVGVVLGGCVIIQKKK